MHNIIYVVQKIPLPWAGVFLFFFLDQPQAFEVSKKTRQGEFLKVSRAQFSTQKFHKSTHDVVGHDFVKSLYQGCVKHGARDHS